MESSAIPQGYRAELGWNTAAERISVLYFVCCMCVWLSVFQQVSCLLWDSNKDAALYDSYSYLANVAAFLSSETIQLLAIVFGNVRQAFQMDTFVGTCIICFKRRTTSVRPLHTHSGMKIFRRRKEKNGCLDFKSLNRGGIHKSKYEGIANRR